LLWPIRRPISSKTSNCITQIGMIEFYFAAHAFKRCEKQAIDGKEHHWDIHGKRRFGFFHRPSG